MKNLIALGAGLLFGAGLYVAMMADPNKVLAFLDLAGAWDPSLALVMVGAIAVSAVGFAVSRRMQTSFSGQAFAWPTLSKPDLKLIGGAALFGIGWGMTGYCPGPGFAALAINPAEALPYLLAMAVGMVFWDRLAVRGQTG
ncbi:MAG: YeeE/YedE family protein [Wenzhouxiangella sp.]|nr:YeeE/YedE family protein [Wenzhouxiangella sp.]MCH8477904.1 YeeE/YedE family protein [Wenzhouxiangella sp.]TVR94582.1 MAG: hypothetical protein EA418_09765 [Wenzhouxiangellaceae bacterium]